jgi:hypothetical protein
MEGQGRLFNPDNPPLAFPKDEAEEELDRLRAQMADYQLQRARAHNIGKHGAQ